MRMEKRGNPAESSKAGCCGAEVLVTKFLPYLCQLCHLLKESGIEREFYWLINGDERGFCGRINGDDSGFSLV